MTNDNFRGLIKFETSMKHQSIIQNNFNTPGAVGVTTSLGDLVRVMSPLQMLNSGEHTKDERVKGKCRHDVVR